MKKILSLLAIIFTCFTFLVTTVTAGAESVNTFNDDSSEVAQEVVPDEELIYLLKEYDKAVEKLEPYLKDENISKFYKDSENQKNYCRNANNFYKENNWNNFNRKEKYSYGFLNYYMFSRAKGICDKTNYFRKEYVLQNDKINKKYIIDKITNSENVFLEPSKIEKNTLNEFAKALVNVLEWYYDEFMECNLSSNDLYYKIGAENMEECGINVPDPFKTYIKYVVRKEEPKVTLETSSNVSSEVTDSSESETSVIDTELSSSEIDSDEEDEDSSDEEFDEDENEDENENKFLRILKNNIVSLIFIIVALVVLIVIAIKKRGK